MLHAAPSFLNYHSICEAKKCDASPDILTTTSSRKITSFLFTQQQSLCIKVKV